MRPQIRLLSMPFDIEVVATATEFQLEVPFAMKWRYTFRYVGLLEFCKLCLPGGKLPAFSENALRKTSTSITSSVCVLKIRVVKIEIYK